MPFTSACAFRSAKPAFWASALYPHLCTQKARDFNDVPFARKFPTDFSFRPPHCIFRRGKVSISPMSRTGRLYAFCGVSPLPGAADAGSDFQIRCIMYISIHRHWLFCRALLRPPHPMPALCPATMRVDCQTTSQSVILVRLNQKSAAPLISRRPL